MLEENEYLEEGNMQLASKVNCSKIRGRGINDTQHLRTRVEGRSDYDSGLLHQNTTLTVNQCEVLGASWEQYWVARFWNRQEKAGRVWTRI